MDRAHFGFMNRRAALKTLSAALLGAEAAACARHPASHFWPDPRAARRFARVRVDPSRVIRTVVGLRPYRPSGFVVRAERLDDKTVIHNYGHGGGGITLSWGTADLAVQEAMLVDAPACAVVGCGAVGLATARLLQRRGRQVTIYARDLPPHTTSNIAGGQWAPYSVVDDASMTPAFREQFVRAARLSHRHFQDLLGPGYGVRWIENYVVSDDPIRHGWFFEELPELFHDVGQLDPDQHPFRRRYAQRFATMFVEPPVYLPALTRDFQLAGGRIVVRDFADRASLMTLSEPLIVNCTGLGARALFGDTELTAVKGQLHVLLPQPEVDYIVLAGGLYMFPRSDGILLGGTFERDVWTLEPNPDETRRIREGHARLFGTT